MNNLFNFFLNAIKAILLSPFYILYFVVVLLIGLFNHLIGEVRILLSGFKYATDKENKYNKKLQQKAERKQKRKMRSA